MTFAISEYENLIRDAVSLVPSRHRNGDVAWVEAAETLRYHPEARALEPEELAKRVTESLDEAAEEWEAEKRH